jgi:uncharacterized membrane protein
MLFTSPVQHLSGSSVPCSVTGGCEEVLTSSYAVSPEFLSRRLAPLLIQCFQSVDTGCFRLSQRRETAAAAGRDDGSVSVWLFYLQAAVIRAFCQFCLLSAAITIACA